MKRNFCLGSEWLYFKIYTGVKTTDLILLEKLKPLIFQFQHEKLIDKWFFVRYKDPQEHLRIRFRITQPDALSQIVAMLYPVVNDLLQDDMVWKVQTDTYQREIERYGENTIEESETLFWHDSEMMLHYIGLKPEFPLAETQLMFTFLAVDSLLNSFSFSGADKLELLDGLQQTFKKEFNADKTLSKELDKNYRQLRQDIQGALSQNLIAKYPEIATLVFEKQNQMSQTVLEIKEKLQISPLYFLGSHIHMMINRQYTSQQRMYEVLIYDHLYRYYKTMAYQEKKINI